MSPLPRFQPITPQPAPQSGSPTIFFPAPSSSTVRELATISALNASVSTAVSSSGWSFNASGIAYRCGAVLFTTTAGIAAGNNLFTVTFQHPFRGVPIVVCGGGPFCIVALLASNLTTTAFAVFNVTAVSLQANQVMQWIAIGV